MRRPRRSATQPHTLGATIFVTMTRATRVPMATGVNPRDSRYSGQNGSMAPVTAKKKK